MAMGRRKAKPIPLFVATEDLPAAPSVPFLERLNAILEKNGFDRLVEDLCRQFYAERLGRPSLPPGVYFRFLMLGLLMGLDSERRIALLVNDSLSLRAFVGYGVYEAIPDSSTLSRTRRLITRDVREQILKWVLQRLREADWAERRQSVKDTTTLQRVGRKQMRGNAREFARRLAAAAGETAESAEETAQLDRTRKGDGPNDEQSNA